MALLKPKIRARIRIVYGWMEPRSDQGRGHREAAGTRDRRGKPNPDDTIGTPWPCAPGTYNDIYTHVKLE